MMSGANQKGSESAEEPELKRRRRTAEEKRQIVEAALKPGASVVRVAEVYGVHSSQVFKWRRLYRREPVSKVQAVALLPVCVAEVAEQAEKNPSPVDSSEGRQRGMIRIEFAQARVSIDGSADAATVRAVLECLAG